MSKLATRETDIPMEHNNAQVSSVSALVQPDANDQPINAQDHNNAPPEGNHTANSPSKREVWLPRIKLAVAVTLPVFLETMDYTVVATAQPKIASVFNRLDLQSYIGTAYVLGSTIFLPIFASLADVFGRYWAMQASVIFFIVGSAISTGANNMEALLVGRGIAGIGAAGLITLVRIVLSDSASLDDNNAQNALMIIVYSAGYSVGPTIGGRLLKISWRWIFGINLPICAGSMILMALLLPKISKGPQPPQRLKSLPPHLHQTFWSQAGTGIFRDLLRLDLVGAAIFIVLGILILLGLNWGSTERWDQARVIVCLSVGVFLLIVFIIWEYLVDHSMDHLTCPEKILGNDMELQRIAGEETSQEGALSKKLGLRVRISRATPKFTRITDPILPMNMFTSFDFVATNLATLSSGMVMLGIFYFVAIFFVVVAGKDSASSGAQLLYFAPGIGIGVVVSLALVKVVRQPRVAIFFSNIVLPIGLGLLGQALYDKKEKLIMGYMIMTGAGVGLGFGPLTYQARFTQPEEYVAVVVASSQFFRTLGGTIGLAQLSTVMYSRLRNHISSQITSGRITPLQGLQIQSALNSIETAGGILGLPDELKEVTIEAFRDGLRWAFFSLLPWLGISFLLCLFLSKIPAERLNPKQREGATTRQ